MMRLTLLSILSHAVAFTPMPRYPRASIRMRPRAAIPEFLTTIHDAVQHSGQAYNYALAHHMQATTCAQSFLLVGTGDAVAQLVDSTKEASEQKKSFDAGRTLRMASLGLIISGFGTTNWLRFLESKLPGHPDWETIVEKALLDGTVWAPIANGVYLFLVPLLEGKELEEILIKCSTDFVPVMKTELSTFLPYNLISFSLIPPHLRPFTTGFVSMCFAIYLSLVSHNEGDGDAHSLETAPGGPSTPESATD